MAGGASSGAGGDVAVVVVCARDAEAYAGACALASAVGARFVDRLSAELVDLQLVVRYRVTEPVCVLLLRGGVVIARVPRLPSEAELRADLVWAARA